jgi:hypothetical protein
MGLCDLLRDRELGKGQAHLAATPPAQIPTAVKMIPLLGGEVAMVPSLQVPAFNRPVTMAR